MSINFDAIKKDVQAFNKRTKKASQSDEVFWKPTGEHIIRVVPYVHDPSDSFRRFLVYYELSRSQVVSPATYGKDDPVISYCLKLKNSGNSDNYKLAKKLEPKYRYYLPIIVRGEEHKGVRFYGFTENVYNKFAKFLLSGDYGDISDLNKGHDVAIEYVKGNKEYPETIIMIKPNATPAFTVPGQEKVLEATPNLEDMFEAPTTQELAHLLEEYLAQREQQAKNDLESVASEKIPNNVKSAMDSFDALFNS
jgi:hypothetical protein